MAQIIEYQSIDTLLINLNEFPTQCKRIKENDILLVLQRQFCLVYHCLSGRLHEEQVGPQMANRLTFVFTVKLRTEGCDISQEGICAHRSLTRLSEGKFHPSCCIGEWCCQKNAIRDPTSLFRLAINFHAVWSKCDGKLTQVYLHIEWWCEIWSQMVTWDTCRDGC